MIIISGFDNFHYARQALRLGIEDYLLKPVNVDELMELVKSVTARIWEQKEQQTSDEEEAITQLLLHTLFQTPLPKRIDVKQDQWFDAYRLLMSEVAGYSELQESLSGEAFAQVSEAVKLAVEESCRSHGIKQISLYGHENELITLCYSDNPEVLADAQLSNVWRDVMKQCPYPIQTVASSIGESFSRCLVEYEQALRLLDDVRGQTRGLLFGGATGKSLATYPLAFETKLVEAILANDESNVEACLHQLVSELLTEGQSLSQIVNICRELVRALQQKLQERLPKKSFQQIDLRLQKVFDLRFYNTTSAIEQIFLRDLIDFLDEMKEADHGNWVIENIKRYIKKHYQKDLRAAEVAELHFITPNYFSMLFKKETGQSFSEYLNGLRIQKSAELLLTTSNKVFEIAEYVGYKEYKYFVQVFKKQLGLTPTHYRRLNATEETMKK
ncbi:two-component response regulator YesN [Bacillus sp. JCM 19045]|nr:two-component response regulator YesN [Bacillus sp. JCM 19045]